MSLRSSSVSILPRRSPNTLSRCTSHSGHNRGRGLSSQKWIRSRISGTDVTYLKGRSLKSAWASSRASRIFTSSVSLTGTSSPTNLVVDKNFSLKIIDFDVAMQVESEDETVDGQCGTKGWMAPEMAEKSRYSPIKADRWSTGKVLLCLLNRFRKEDKVLETAAAELTAYNPERRLSMLQVAASLSDVANVAVERKASRSLQDTMEVDRENVEV